MGEDDDDADDAEEAVAAATSAAIRALEDMTRDIPLLLAGVTEGIIRGLFATGTGATSRLR